MKMVFVSRGHGFGHAARDLKVLREIRRLAPDLEVVLASADSGVDFYRGRGVDVVDLDFPDALDTESDATWKVWRFLYEHADADLVVVDEIMSVPGFVANVLQLPVVLITDWFFVESGYPEGDAMMDGAATVIVPDFAQAHPQQPSVAAPVEFTGPLVERFEHTRSDARRRLGIADDALVWVVALGGRPDRRAALEIQLQVLRVWNARKRPGDVLLLLADAPGPAPARAGDDIRWCGRTGDPDLYYRAADLVVADALGFTPCELVYNGIPTVAVLHPDPSRHVRTGVRDRMALLESSGFLAVCEGASDDDAFQGAVAAVTGGACGTAALPPPLAWGSAVDLAREILGFLPGGDSARADGRDRSQDKELVLDKMGGR
ncbi:glycosyltransferase family protein [Oerskovia turbata]